MVRVNRANGLVQVGVRAPECSPGWRAKGLVNQIIPGHGRISFEVRGDIRPDQGGLVLEGCTRPVLVLIRLGRAVRGTLSSRNTVKVDDRVNPALPCVGDQPVHFFKCVRAPGAIQSLDIAPPERQPHTVHAQRPDVIEVIGCNPGILIGLDQTFLSGDSEAVVQCLNDGVIIRQPRGIHRAHPSFHQQPAAQVHAAKRNDIALAVIVPDILAAGRSEMDPVHRMIAPLRTRRPSAGWILKQKPRGLKR